MNSITNFVNTLSAALNQNKMAIILLQVIAITLLFLFIQYLLKARNKNGQHTQQQTWTSTIVIFFSAAITLLLFQYFILPPFSIQFNAYFSNNKLLSAEPETVKLNKQ